MFGSQSTQNAVIPSTPSSRRNTQIELSDDDDDDDLYTATPASNTRNRGKNKRNYRRMNSHGFEEEATSPALPAKKP